MFTVPLFKLWTELHDDPKMYELFVYITTGLLY